MAVSFGKVQETTALEVEVLSGNSWMRVPVRSLEMLDSLKTRITESQKQLEESEFAKTFPIGSEAILVRNNWARDCEIERLEINLVMPGLQLVPCIYLKFNRQTKVEYFPLEDLHKGHVRLVKALEDLYEDPNA